MIPQDFIDELLSRIDIVEIIEPRVALKKGGKDYQGLCPFHNEKSPSFTVSQDKGFYHCFGCQQHGSALTFLVEHDRMDFISAVELLAERVGMEIPQQDTGVSKEVHKRRRTMHEMLERASGYYKDQLRQHESKDRAVDYLKERGLSGEIARDFQLGYAPPGWDNLQSALATSNADRELLVESGMLIENEERTYDRFRDRIMFPIRDLRGKTIAFGGRIMGDDKPKYLNSPETPVFHKGRELYGLYEARQRTSRLEQVIVVEGYMDVVALAQHGINYSVATLGTATSTDHIDRLYRLVSKIVFCFDGDEAGRNAAWKALNTVLEFLQDGRSASFLFLPDGEDPDSLVREDGHDRFELRLREAATFTTFFYAHLEAELDAGTPEGKAALSKLAMPLINQIPEGVFKQLMIDELSNRTGLDTERLLTVSAGYRKKPRREYSAEPRVKEGQRKPQGSLEQIDQAVSMLLHQPELVDLFEPQEYARLSADDPCKSLMRLIKFIISEDAADLEKIFAHFQGEAEFDYLRQLANKEQLLDVSQYKDEFSGIITQRLGSIEDGLKRRSISELLEKPLSELSEPERELIRRFHQNQDADS